MVTRNTLRRAARHIRWVSSFVAICAALAGCTAQKADVSVAANVPSQYSHVWLTVKEIWFNTSASATAEDTTWHRFQLVEPVTVDLASAAGGTLAQIASGLNLPGGTYSQIRLIPVDPSAALTSSASAAGAQFNAEADYVDSAGVTRKVALELLNPDKGFAVATTLTIKVDTSQFLGHSSLASTTSTTLTAPTALTAPTTSPASTTSTAPTTSPASTTSTAPTTSPASTTLTAPTTSPGSTPLTAPTASPASTPLTAPTTSPASTPLTAPTIGPTSGMGTTGTTGTTAANVTLASTSTATAAPASLAINLDGAHDLVQFTYGTQTAVLLNPHTSALDVSSVGAIRGQIDLANIATSVESGGQVDVRVTAEVLSRDGSRHLAIKSVQVASDGSFLLYPLSTSSGSATTYDLVIHGSQIATVVIKSVPVTVADPSTTGAVSVGTVAPRSVPSFSFNLVPGTQPLSAGALVNLFQTLPGSGEVPYLIEQTAVEPFTRTLFTDQAVATGTIDVGTYVSGATVALASVTPVQGASTYLVSAQAPLFSDGTLTTRLSQPSGGTALVSIPSLIPADGSSTSTISISVAATTPGKYDHGELIVSHDGGIVQTVTIDALLAQNGRATLLIPDIPGGGGGSSFDNAVYYVSARAWNSRDPAGTLQRESYSTPVDLRAGSVTGLSVNVD